MHSRVLSHISPKLRLSLDNTREYICIFLTEMRLGHLIVHEGRVRSECGGTVLLRRNGLKGFDRGWYN